MPSHTPRTRDLEKALRAQNGTCKNGNHLTEVTPGVKAFDSESTACQMCSLSFRCMYQQVDLSLVIEKGLPCIRAQGVIKFRYHGTICLTFDVANNRITDHGYWGYSITTTRAIGWYVNALSDLRFINNRDVRQIIEQLRKRAKQQTAKDWIYV